MDSCIDSSCVMQSLLFAPTDTSTLLQLAAAQVCCHTYLFFSLTAGLTQGCVV